MNRKLIALPILFAVFTFTVTAQNKSLKNSRPNIIFVLTDDQGMGDLSCMGNEVLKTPHIDNFYENSLRFTDYQVSPTCAPTRAAIMSGRVPFKNGVTHTIFQRERMALDVYTLPQALQSAGYTTGLFGKWHLGDEEKYLPGNRGFDEVLMHGAGGIGQSRWGDFPPNADSLYFDNVLLHNDTIVQTKGFCTDLFFDASMAWIKKQQEAKKPYFAYVSLNAPHGPFRNNAPEKYQKRFLEAGYDKKTAVRYGMIENIDDNFGAMLSQLKEWNALENTMVIFMTDNGMSMAPINYDGEKIFPHNAGMKGRKNTPYEGGTHVPFFVQWQGVLEKGTDINALTSHIDLYQTFCDLAGVDLPKEMQALDGRSLLPLLEDKNAKWAERELFIHCGRWGAGEREAYKYKKSAVRTDRWRFSNNKELYDISVDAGETQNVFDAHPEIVQQLQHSYDQWWESVLPLMVNERLPKIDPEEQPLVKRYYKQLSEFGIPEWAPENNSSSLSAQDKPNVIIVITDDQGKNDLACMGNPYIKTPNMDKLYRESVRFTNYHVSSTCAPSRGSLMTGRHTNRLNVFHTITGRSLLFEDEVILPQIFAQNGYVNGMFGKWHLGDNYPFRPEDRGFHEVVRHGGGGITQGPDYWGNDYFDDTYWHNGVTEQYKGYCTDVFFSEAMDFIEDNSDHPFFCYISTNAPHVPLNLTEEYYNLYKDNPNLPKNTKRFYGMITNIDDNMKRLEDKLQELDIVDNTILIFTTDNGTAWGKDVYSAGLKGGKASEYEGGHRVPLFIRWPNGKLTGGKDIDQLVAHYDLLPTFVDLFGFNFNPVKPLDGKSLKPLLYEESPKWENRILYTDTQRKQNLIKYKAYSVMDDNWRLVNRNELYDINKDLGQTKNVVDQYPEVADRLAEGYEKWWQSIMSKGPNERYAYIKVGSPKENPSRISAHDMYVGTFARVWSQYGAAEASQIVGRWKIEFIEDGEYAITLRRFPRESGLAINATFPAQKKTMELDRLMPASIKSDFVTAKVYVADIEESAKIETKQTEVTFTGKVSAGKYDMEAHLIDKDGRVYPAYYIYIEKLSNL